MKLYWNKTTTEKKLHSALQTLGEEYPIFETSKSNEDGILLIFKQSQQDGLCEVHLKNKEAIIHYSTPVQAIRATGTLLSGLVQPEKIYREKTSFQTIGIMLDCSRNAVITVEHFKYWLRRLALLGYNMAMLYTEETYQLPDEPYFGFHRGAYTPEKLKTIDEYAARLNIEMIPCIQTLGHLEKILKYPVYKKIRDTSSVLLVDEPATYALIEKMISFWKNVYRTDRIHIGMDEAHDLGRGQYLDLHGYRSAFELFNTHLGRVVSICSGFGLKPMIWSDMYFRIGSRTHSYHDLSAIIPQEVIKKIPAEVQLVYWDYYRKNIDDYLRMIQRHREMGKEPIMASGIWTWDRYWYDRYTTEANAGACIDACIKAGIKEIFFTQWGDNGAYCDHDSAFAGMTWCAEKCYGHSTPSIPSLKKRFEAVCGGNYTAHIIASKIHGGIKKFQPNMWDDPFWETHFRTYTRNSIRVMNQIAEGFSKLASELAQYRNMHQPGNLEYAYRIAETFGMRYHFVTELVDAYRKKDKKRIKKLRAQIPTIIRHINTLEDTFRSMWISHNKSEGIETIQARFGMLIIRYREIGRQLDEWLSGKRNKISELEWVPPF